MVKLLEGQNVTLGRTVKYFGADYIEIAAIGDGNCALNSFALGLIDLIKRDQFALVEARQKEWVAVLRSASVLNVLRARLEIYRIDSWASESIETGYEDLADGLEQFIQLAERNDFNYAMLINYIKENSQNRLQVAALHVALAPSLREIGTTLYVQQLEEIGVDDPQLLVDAKNLKQDRAWAGHEILMPLAREFFTLNVTIQDDVLNCVYDEPELPGCEHINIVKVTGHWNFCVPAEQQNGIATALNKLNPPAAFNADNITWNFDEAMTLVQFAANIARSIVQKLMFTVNELNEMRLVLKNAAKNLLSLAGQKDAPKEVKQLIETQDTSTKAIMEKVRSQMDLRDEKIKSYKFNDLQKDVLRGNYASIAQEPSDKGKEETQVVDQAILDDERLARTLQEVEVLAFMKKNKWKSFFKKAEPVIAKPVEPMRAVSSAPAISVK